MPGKVIYLKIIYHAASSAVNIIKKMATELLVGTLIHIIIKKKIIIKK